VFLDLKFHDIPTTVAGAITAATRLGVWMVNVHASGGSAMMRAARAAADEEAARRSRPAPLVIAVTMLTSLDLGALTEIGLDATVAAQVDSRSWRPRLAWTAWWRRPRSSRDPRLRTDFTSSPGIRGGGAQASPDDQQRTLTAAQAVAAGSSYLVVGRPITAASDPREAARQIAKEAR
jgi:orotidine-5'-phosphate decarboxylase